MYYAEKRALSKKTRDAMALTILLLLLLIVIIGMMYLRILERDRQLNALLIHQEGEELTEAYESVILLSRAGGSYTTMQIGKLRQHLYAGRRLNAITGALYGRQNGMFKDEQLIKALDYLTTCESRLMKGQAIDEPLKELRGLLEVLTAD